MKKIHCLLLLAFFACSKKDNPDAVPAHIQWLIDQANCTCSTTIDKYIWRSKVIYVVGSQPMCNTAGFYYDKHGNNLGNSLDPDITTFQDFLKEAQHVKNYYTCEEQ